MQQLLRPSASSAPKQCAVPVSLPLVQSDFDIGPYLHAQHPLYIRMLIKPEMARQWLDLYNTKNRKLSETHAMKLGCDLLEGRWVYNAEPIRFTCEGVISDGQHRLFASVESEIPIDALVVFGLHPDTIFVTDIPKVRTAADIAHLEDIPNARACCALATLLWVHETYGPSKIHLRDVRPSKPQQLEMLRKNPRIIEIASLKSTFERKVDLPPSISMYCYYLLSERDPAAAESFFNKLETGVALTQHHPVYELRKRLADNVKAKAKLDNRHLVALVFKAWNAYRKGETVYNLRWRSEGAAAEEFPTI